MQGTLVDQNCPKYVQKRFSFLHLFQHIHRDCEWLVLVQMITQTYMSHKQSDDNQVWDRVHDKTIYRPALPGTSTTQSTRRDESRYLSSSSSWTTWRINDILTLTSNIFTNVIYRINIITTKSIIDRLYVCGAIINIFSGGHLFHSNGLVLQVLRVFSLSDRYSIHCHHFHSHHQRQLSS